MAGDDIVDVLGVRVSAVDLDLAIARIEDLVAGRVSSYITVTGVHGVMESQRDEALLQIHNRAAMVTPDGMPLVWAARRAGATGTARVYGPDLLLAMCEKAAPKGLRMFFFGGGAGVAEALAERMERAYGITVAGVRTPAFPPEEPSSTSADVEAINAARPDIVWVGLSTPKQERWMAAARPFLAAPVLIGVGAAFDIHSGRIPQAPMWMQRSGLEWTFRLAHEPRRLWRRYLRNNPAFVASILRRPPTRVPAGATS